MSKMSQLSADIEEIKATLKILTDTENPVHELRKPYRAFIDQAISILPTLLTMVEGQQQTIESKQAQKTRSDAWVAVCGALDEVCPSWLDVTKEAKDSAVQAIKNLAIRPVIDPDWSMPENASTADYSAVVSGLGMYSYDRPSWIVWNRVMNVLIDKGFSEEAAKQWLKSKAPRWALDGTFGDILNQVAYKWAVEKAESYFDKAQCEEWAEKNRG